MLNKYEIYFSPFDIGVLRRLAGKVKILSERSIEKAKREKWIAINELRSVSPIVFADPENGWKEIITPNDLKCENALAKKWEMKLRKEIFWAQEIKDDKVIEPFFDVPYVFTDTGWGMDITFDKVAENGSYHVNAPLVDYEKDFGKLRFPDLIIDYVKTEHITRAARDAFDGILDVRNNTKWWWTLGMTWDYINLRGLDKLMMDLITEPEWVHKMMVFLESGYQKRLDFLEASGLLFNNNNDSYIGSGGFGYIKNELNENTGEKIFLRNMWGFAESQETVGVSPEMFNEFILPYQIRLLERFGLNCYGCCEPINARWKYVKNILRLRRVSSSPWADRYRMSEQLGGEFIMSAKASPTPLAMKNLNEDEVRDEIKKILDARKNRPLEIIMKDNHTLGNNPNNITRWVEIVREEIRKAGF